MSLLLGLGLGELWLRWRGWPPEIVVTSPIEPETAGSARLSLFGANLFEQGTEGARMRPRYRSVIQKEGTGRQYTVETNSLGLRNRELGPKKAARIMFLGDSIAFGLDTEEERTYVRLTETILRQTSPGVEVVNAGVPGLSLDNEIALLEEVADRLQPDLIVLNFYLNDFRSTPLRAMPVPPSSLRNAWIVQSLYRMGGVVAAKAFPYRSASDPTEQQLDEWCSVVAQRPWTPSELYTERPEYFNFLLKQTCRELGNAWAPPAWGYLSERLDRFRAVAQKHGAQVEIVSFPMALQLYLKVEDRWPEDQLLAWAAERGQHVFDVLELYQNAVRASPSLELYPPGDPCHPNEAGHRLLAEALAEHLGGLLGAKINS